MRQFPSIHILVTSIILVTYLAFAVRLRDGEEPLPNPVADLGNPASSVEVTAALEAQTAFQDVLKGEGADPHSPQDQLDQMLTSFVQDGTQSSGGEEEGQGNTTAQNTTAVSQDVNAAMVGQIAEDTEVSQEVNGAKVGQITGDLAETSSSGVPSQENLGEVLSAMSGPGNSSSNDAQIDEKEKADLFSTVDEWARERDSDSQMFSKLTQLAETGGNVTLQDEYKKAKKAEQRRLSQVGQTKASLRHNKKRGEAPQDTMKQQLNDMQSLHDMQHLKNDGDHEKAYKVIKQQREVLKRYRDRLAKVRAKVKAAKGKTTVSSQDKDPSNSDNDLYQIVVRLDDIASRMALNRREDGIMSEIAHLKSRKFMRNELKDIMDKLNKIEMAIAMASASGSSIAADEAEPASAGLSSKVGRSSSGNTSDGEPMRGKAATKDADLVGLAAHDLADLLANQTQAPSADSTDTTSGDIDDVALAKLGDVVDALDGVAGRLQASSSSSSSDDSSMAVEDCDDKSSSSEEAKTSADSDDDDGDDPGVEESSSSSFSSDDGGGDDEGHVDEMTEPFSDASF